MPILGEPLHPHLEQLLDGAAPGAVPGLLALIHNARLAERPLVSATEIAAAVRPFTALLSAVGGGCRLTAAGYLPPAIVTALMSELGWDEWWVGKGNREDWTIPILELRSFTTDFGLLRRRTGSLLPTPLARRVRSDPEALWGILVDRCTRARYPATRDAVTLLLLLVARDEPLSRSRYTHRIRALMNEHGWRRPSGDPLDDRGVGDLIRPTWDLLGMLGLVSWGASRHSEAVRSRPGVAFARAALSTAHT